MKNWEQIRPVVEQILRGKNYQGTPCFLTAYQLAVLVDKEDSSLKENLPIGGEGMGNKANNQSFAQQIALSLSNDINKNDDTIEMQFFSIAGLDAFTFDGENTPSSNEFSMFRIKG